MSSTINPSCILHPTVKIVVLTYFIKIIQSINLYTAILY